MEGAHPRPMGRGGPTHHEPDATVCQGGCAATDRLPPPPCMPPRRGAAAPSPRVAALSPLVAPPTFPAAGGQGVCAKRGGMREPLFTGRGGRPSPRRTSPPPAVVARYGGKAHASGSGGRRAKRGGRGPLPARRCVAPTDGGESPRRGAGRRPDARPPGRPRAAAGPWYCTLGEPCGAPPPFHAAAPGRRVGAPPHRGCRPGEEGVWAGRAGAPGGVRRGGGRGEAGGGADACLCPLNPLPPPRLHTAHRASG